VINLDATIETLKKELLQDQELGEKWKDRTIHGFIYLVMNNDYCPPTVDGIIHMYKEIFNVKTIPPIDRSNHDIVAKGWNEFLDSLDYYQKDGHEQLLEGYNALFNFLDEKERDLVLTINFIYGIFTDIFSRTGLRVEVPSDPYQFRYLLIMLHANFDKTQDPVENEKILQAIEEKTFQFEYKISTEPYLNYL
jgi:hypothetical protein